VIAWNLAFTAVCEAHHLSVTASFKVAFQLWTWLDKKAIKLIMYLPVCVH